VPIFVPCSVEKIKGRGADAARPKVTSAARFVGFESVKVERERQERDAESDQTKSAGRVGIEVTCANICTLQCRKDQGTWRRCCAAEGYVGGASFLCFESVKVERERQERDAESDQTKSAGRVGIEVVRSQHRKLAPPT
jgi:hypothetical protein